MSTPNHIFNVRYIRHYKKISKRERKKDTIQCNTIQLRRYELFVEQLKAKRGVKSKNKNRNKSENKNKKNKQKKKENKKNKSENKNKNKNKNKKLINVNNMATFFE